MDRRRIHVVSGHFLMLFWIEPEARGIGFTQKLLQMVAKLIFPIEGKAMGIYFGIRRWMKSLNR